MTTSVIVAGARTPIGRLMGSLKDFSDSDLGGVAIAAALRKAFPDAEDPASAVEYVIMGQVLTAGAGQMPARQAAVAAPYGHVELVLVAGDARLDRGAKRGDHGILYGQPLFLQSVREIHDQDAVGIGDTDQHQYSHQRHHVH